MRLRSPQQPKERMTMGSSKVFRLLNVWETYLFVVLLGLQDQTESSLNITSFFVPKEVLLGSEARLLCNYILNEHILYSYKWYKNEKEFYRYMPSKVSPIQIFSLEGVTVDVPRSDQYTVILLNVSRKSAGIYKCEVSGEGPLFRTAVRKEKMNIYVLHDPVIERNRLMYEEMEYLDLNCTSFESYPISEIEWFVNEEKADPSMLKKYEVVRSSDSLYTTTVALQFYITRDHFYEGEMNLRCKTKVSSFHWKIKEITVYEKYHKFSKESSSAVQQYLPNSSLSRRKNLPVLEWCLVMVSYVIKVT